MKTQKGISRIIEQFNEKITLFEQKRTDNDIERIVLLFQTMSPLHDLEKELFDEVLPTLIRKRLFMSKSAFEKRRKLYDELIILRNCLRNMGRDYYGMNRTKSGEEVLYEHVYLGDVFGVWTKPAHYWLKNKEKLMNDLRPDISKDPNNPVTTWYLINTYQAKSFVDKNITDTKEMITRINELAA